MLMQTRGPSFGRCNICGIEGKLTEDHTPPKGVIRVGQVELHHITARLSAEEPSGRHRKFQNGVKYRTLCARCNNGLGKHDDPALIHFSRLVHSVMSSTWPMSPGLIKPQNVMRSVLGHLCAQGVDRYLKGKATERLAWYLTERTTTLPTSIEVYWWVYPFRHQVVARDMAYLDVPSGHVMSTWMMKFFPLAFLVVFERPRQFQFPLNELSAFRDCDSDEDAEIVIDCRSVMHQHWPEAPTDNAAIMYGPEASFARER